MGRRSLGERTIMCGTPPAYFKRAARAVYGVMLSHVERYQTTPVATAREK